AKPNVEVLEQDVKRAQDRVVAHKESGSRKMEAANRKVEIAQAKLNEVTKKYGPDSSQALRAQDQLITAQQKAEAATLDITTPLDGWKGNCLALRVRWIMLLLLPVSLVRCGSV